MREGTTLTWRRPVTRPGLLTTRRQPPPRHRPSYEHTLPGLGDRRRLERRRFRFDVLVVPLESHLPCRSAASEDISSRGIFVSCSTQYPLRTVLRLRLHTDWGEMSLTARVVHRLQGIGFGCQFINLDSTQRAGLSFLVEVCRQRAEDCQPVH